MVELLQQPPMETTLLVSRRDISEGFTNVLPITPRVEVLGLERTKVGSDVPLRVFCDFS